MAESRQAQIKLYDTTLRDGAQSEHVAWSLEDKLEIARELDRFGVDYIEGGWPGSNPKDLEFFFSAQGLPLQHARIAAFGSTHHVKYKPEDDPNLRQLVQAGTPVITIFGKSWDLHVTKALRVKLDENLKMISGSLRFLKPQCQELLYDAEHFFDGLKANPEYALSTLRAAVEGGAQAVILCDTNGGSLPDWIAEGVERAAREVGPGLVLGIHAHNDSGLATANTLAAVARGCLHVQGTINGFGERCGNADLCQVIPNLQLKAGRRVVSDEKLRTLAELSRFVYNRGALPWRDNQPYVGRSAFAHKGGIHVSAVLREESAYEHIRPELVGNQRRVLISELSGRSNIAAVFGDRFGLERFPEKRAELLERVQNLESEGYQFESAEASFELLARKVTGQHAPFFVLHGFRVSSEVREDGREVSEATIKVAVNEQPEHTAAEGNGPVSALDHALRKALLKFYPELAEISLVNYTVRIVNPKAATDARVMVHITTQDNPTGDRWRTVGVSENVIQASWLALVDAIEYKLFRTRAGAEARPAAAATPEPKNTKERK